MIFNKENVERYKLTFEKDGYFTEEKEFTQTAFSSDNYTFNLVMTPASYIKINIRNTVPYSNDDYFKYRITEGYKDVAGACKQTGSYTGTSVNTKEEGYIIGGKVNKIEYWIVKNNETTHSIKTIYCPVNDTAIVNFNS